MDRKSKALVIVAWLLVIEGGLSILQGLSNISHGVSLNVSMLALPVGLGLLWGSGWWRGGNFWRGAALFVLGLQLFFLASIPVILLVKPPGLEPYAVLRSAGGPLLLIVGIALAVVALKVWQFQVVLRS